MPSPEALERRRERDREFKRKLRRERRDEMRIYQRERRAKNRDKINAQVRDRRLVRRDEINARNRERYATDADYREKTIAAVRDYSHRNRDAVAERQRVYRQEHPESIRECHAVWRETHPRSSRNTPSTPKTPEQLRRGQEKQRQRNDAARAVATNYHSFWTAEQDAVALSPLSLAVRAALTGRSHAAVKQRAAKLRHHHGAISSP